MLATAGVSQRPRDDHRGITRTEFQDPLRPAGPDRGVEHLCVTGLVEPVAKVQLSIGGVIGDLKLVEKRAKLIT